MLSTQQRNPIEIKISTVVAIAIILHDANLGVLESAIKKLTAHSSDYYSQECAVVDVSQIDATSLNWVDLIQLLKSHSFHPVAVRHAPPACEAQITELGLLIDLGSKAAPRLDAPVPKERLAQPNSIAHEIKESTPLIVDTPVRAGQRIYARGSDLIVTAVVNSGAEIIADGNIHVYAPLRGRALAGASGNIAARIFTMGLEAELVSIAGIYRTFEHGYPKLAPHMPLQIQLNGDKIQVASILV